MSRLGWCRNGLLVGVVLLSMKWLLLFVLMCCLLIMNFLLYSCDCYVVLYRNLVWLMSLLKFVVGWMFILIMLGLGVICSSFSCVLCGGG